jgi:cell division inhibitor SepF
MRNWSPDESWEQNERKKGFLEKMMNLLGIESEEVVEEVYPVDEEPALVPTGKDRSKVIPLQTGQKSVRLVVLEPRGFDEVQTIVDHLKNRRPVILNMEELDKVMARRIADFVGGAVYALDGAMQKVSAAILLFTPPHVEVTIPAPLELKEERLGVNNPERPFNR